jgi:SNF2 family DNA or RNA helicase/predicted transcriptional regulator
MALRLDPVRLLIADDVGVGKTIEAAMIAREFLDRGIARRIGVLCAPHLCEQWEEELRTKFDIHTAVVQSSRIGRLERGLPRGDVSLYQHYRHLVASIDFVKSERNRQRFLDNAPDFIIVDEAHTAARPRGVRDGAQQQRYALVRDLSRNPQRHMILATATPHSGIEESFRSLLGILDAEFDVPEESDLPRAKLIPHLIQRKRADLKRWLGVDTPFPEREAVERSYRMSADYHKLYQDILAYCREYVSSEGMAEERQRVRYWAALSILRCVLSSPMAARATLENRKPSLAGRRNGVMPNEAFGQQLMDSADEEHATDYVFIAPLDEPDASLDERELRRLNAFLRRADALAGTETDAKIREAARAVSELLSEGHRPIIYCRFIQTAYYVAEQIERELRRKHRGLQVRAVTGNEGDSEQRKEIVLTLAKEPVRVLVATDCLSEGINLQDHYDAVVHYDLPWNPNRLEQREGRVDRFGQGKPVVKTVLLYGADNEVDLVVLEVLLRKAKVIRQRLGISVPVPVDSEQVVNALVSSVLLRGLGQGRQFSLALEDESVSRLHVAWDQMADRENRSRAYFAQQGIEPDEVARELEEMEPVLGGEEDVKRFLANAVQRFNGELRSTRTEGVFQLLPGDLRDRAVARDSRLTFPMLVSFAGVPSPGVTPLGRNHPVVAAASEAVIARALDGNFPGFTRSGAIFTRAVDRRTAVVILRLRYLVEAEGQQFAEEVVPAAFERDGSAVWWLTPSREEALRLLSNTQVAANMPLMERKEHVEWALGMLKDGWADGIVEERVAELEASHARLRRVVMGAKVAKVTPHRPPDVIGCFVLVPAGGSR